MRGRFSLLLAVLASLLLGAPCGVSHQIAISAPPRIVEDFSFPIEFQVFGAIAPGSLEVVRNGVSILDRVTGGPEHFSALIEPGAPLRDHNLLKVRATREKGRGKIVAAPPFK
jgi:hypothetical protein